MGWTAKICCAEQQPVASPGRQCASYQIAAEAICEEKIQKQQQERMLRTMENMQAPDQQPMTRLTHALCWLPKPQLGLLQRG